MLDPVVICTPKTILVWSLYFNTVVLARLEKI